MLLSVVYTVRGACSAYLGHTDGLLLHGFMDAGSVKLTNTVELICRGREAAVVKGLDMKHTGVHMQALLPLLPA